MIDFSKYTLPELRAIGAVMDDLMREDSKLESWKFAVHVRSTAREAFRAESAAIDQQARYAAEVPLAEAPPAEDPEGLRDLQALVDTLSRCTDRLASLALAEDRHFAECSRTDVFNKMITLRNSHRAIMNALADIRDHYDGLH